MSSNCHSVLEGCMLVGGWVGGWMVRAFLLLGVGPLDFCLSGKFSLCPNVATRVFKSLMQIQTSGVFGKCFECRIAFPHSATFRGWVTNIIAKAESTRVLIGQP